MQVFALVLYTASNVWSSNNVRLGIFTSIVKYMFLSLVSSNLSGLITFRRTVSSSTWSWVKVKKKLYCLTSLPLSLLLPIMYVSVKKRRRSLLTNAAKNVRTPARNHNRNSRSLLKSWQANDGHLIEARLMGKTTEFLSHRCPFWRTRPGHGRDWWCSSHIWKMCVFMSTLNVWAACLLLLQRKEACWRPY